MLRTHTCGSLTEKDIGKKAVLCGWVDSRRDHGKIIFVDLRDRYGKTQITVIKSIAKQAYPAAQTFKNEDVVKIEGEVSKRPKGTENLSIPTGKIEVLAEKIEILSPAQEIPFMIEDDIDTSEEIRLSFRFLDLRRRKMLDNLTLRSKINQVVRNFLSQQEFLEVETPFLTKSTPEGARDFLVPARLNPGKFYALPQSPQLFKQVLMVSGIDKYYQIARCFRDEDLRKDRQPEFTQLDLEMSFADEADIFRLTEELFSRVFEQTLGKKIKTPFPRITYKQAVNKYGTDKPDLREETGSEYAFAWITEFPLFKYDEENKKWGSEHHPFTAPFVEDEYLLEKGELGKIRSRSYDLVFNGTELGSGSVRIHKSQMQNRIFSILGITPQEAEEKFGFLLKSFNYGAPPHAGIAFGIDRFIAIITNSESIRDVIAFPKTQKGICLLTNAPSNVRRKQLEELNIENAQEG